MTHEEFKLLMFQSDNSNFYNKAIFSPNIHISSLADESKSKIEFTKSYFSSNMN